VNWNQFGQVPVPRGVRSPKGHEASSITNVCGADVEVVVVGMVEVVVVVVGKVDEVVGVVVDEVVVLEVVLEDPIVDA